MRIRTEHDSCDLNSLELLDLDGPKYELQRDTNESLRGFSHRKDEAVDSEDLI
jgi:hypothetical protein